MQVNDFHFLGSWFINEFNLGKRVSAPGKQNLRVTCPKGKLEFKYFPSPKLYVLLTFWLPNFHTKNAIFNC